MARHEFLAIGVSAGGLDALSTILRGLGADFPMAVCIVQHRSTESTHMCDLLQDRSALPVHDVTDKMDVEMGHVYLAPPDYHILADEGFFSLSTDVPVRYSRPSIDVFFESVADTYGRRCVGLVLTGANADGAEGLARISARGGLTIVQDPDTAEVPFMPQAALHAVPGAVVVPLDELAMYLTTVADEESPSGRIRTGLHE